MYTKLISNPNFYPLLLKFDEDLAKDCWAKPCTHCGGKLNQAHYLRKPRGGILAPSEAKQRRQQQSGRRLRRRFISEWTAKSLKPETFAQQ